MTTTLEPSPLRRARRAARASYLRHFAEECDRQAWLATDTARGGRLADLGAAARRLAARYDPPTPPPSNPPDEADHQLSQWLDDGGR